MNSIVNALKEKLGYPGMLISGSKSGYRKAHPDNLTIFNANICIEETDGTAKKIWWGDIDITLSQKVLREIALEFDTDVRVLYESDARFENEEIPLIANFAYRANGNGTQSLGESISRYYSFDKNGTVSKTKEKV